MLIENIEVELTSLGKLSGDGSQTPIQISGAQDVQVKGINVTYTISGIPTANVSIVIEKNKSVLGIKLTELKKSEFVGSEIKLKWKPGEAYKPFTLFQGIVSGVGITKSTAAVHYTIACTGGPSAMFNTTISVANWYPFGFRDNSSTTAFFNTVIVGKDWSSPRDLFRKLLERLPEPIKRFNTADTPQAAEKHFKLAQKFLAVDSEKLKQPKILEEFFGNIGKFQKFDTEIRERIDALIREGGSSSTYWDLLSQMLREIGCYAVPWVNSTLMLPHMLFSNAIKANVLFPSMIRSISIQSDPLDYPDQIVVYAIAGYFSKGIPNMKHFSRNMCVVFPPDNEINPSEYSPYPSKSYKFLWPPAYAPFILKGAWLNKDLKEAHHDADESREPVDQATESKALILSIKKYKEYLRNYAQFMFHKLRSQNDLGTVECVFNPVIVPGFSSYILDGETGTNYRGLVISVSHSISEQSAGTSVQLSNLTPLQVGPSDPATDIESPLWLELLPEGAEVGPQTAADGTARDGALSKEGARHVTPKEVLDLLADPEKSNALAAALYTTRLEETQKN